MKDAERLALLLRQLLKQLVEQVPDGPTNDAKRVSVEADVALAKKAKAILEASAADVQREIRRRIKRRLPKEQYGAQERERIAAAVVDLLRVRKGR